MKKILLFCGITLVCMISKAQESPYYYYYEGQKQYFLLHTGYAFVSMKEQAIPFDTKQLNAKSTKLQSDRSDKKQYQKQKGTGRFWTELKFEKKLSEEQYLKTLTDMRCQNKDVIVSPCFKTANSNSKIVLSNFFYVKIKAPSDTKLLEEMAKQTNCVIIEQDSFMPLWFVMSVTAQSELNAMECSNFFYESGLFQAAEPNLMANDLLQCANDEYWKQQWGLSNGTTGVDIKACDAWEISKKGFGIKVAVIDIGIQLNHPDLVANLSSQSYDAVNKRSPSTIWNSTGDAHGTWCAGIIGAVQNNGIGISGVAPQCQLMSISSNLSENDPTLYEQNLAAGINWAWQNGADVINCSWGNDFDKLYITNAINEAVTNGRGKKGCVVVCSAGNDGIEAIRHPAKLSNVIAVGAIAPSGKRKKSDDFGTSWGSCYGLELNVMAPGVDIPTTSTSSPGYTTGFWGTSSACPHVSGVAALMLSVNPNLTSAQIRQMIESTAQKVGGYTYQTQPGYANGPWNKEMGYGLVNAYDAVIAATPCVNSYVNQTVITQIFVKGCNNLNVQNVTVSNNAKLILKSSNGEVIINGLFEVQMGSSLDVR